MAQDSGSCEILWDCLPLQRDTEPIYSPNVYKIQLKMDWREPGKLEATIKTTDWIAIKYADTPLKQDIRDLNEEYRLLSLLSRDNRKDIVDVFRLFESSKLERPFFVMERGERCLEVFLSRGDIFCTGKDENFEIDNKYYTIRRSLIWLKQIANALDYLHGKSILHRDLKPGNVLLFDESKQCKLCDFGNSTDAEKIERTPKQGTNPYMAPEMISQIPVPYTQKVDCYSFGILMHTCLCTRAPVDDKISLMDKTLFGEKADTKYNFGQLKLVMGRLTSPPEKRPEMLSAQLQFTELDELDAWVLSGLVIDNMPGLPENELEVRRTQRSLRRKGTTVYYSVVLGNASNQDASNQDERDVVQKTLDGILRHINTKAAKCMDKPINHYMVSSEMHVQPACKTGEFCQVEHIMGCSDEAHESEVSEFCRTNSSYLDWLKSKFSEDPVEKFRNMKFTVNMNASNMRSNEE